MFLRSKKRLWIRKIHQGISKCVEIFLFTWNDYVIWGWWPKSPKLEMMKNIKCESTLQQPYKSWAIDFRRWEIVQNRWKICKSITKVHLHISFIDRLQLHKTHMVVRSIPCKLLWNGVKNGIWQFWIIVDNSKLINYDIYYNRLEPHIKMGLK